MLGEISEKTGADKWGSMVWLARSLILELSLYHWSTLVISVQRQEVWNGHRPTVWIWQDIWFTAGILSFIVIDHLISCFMSVSLFFYTRSFPILQLTKFRLNFLEENDKIHSKYGIKSFICVICTWYKILKQGTPCVHMFRSFYWNYVGGI